MRSGWREHDHSSPEYQSTKLIVILHTENSLTCRIYRSSCHRKGFIRYFKSFFTPNYVLVMLILYIYKATKLCTDYINMHIVTKYLTICSLAIGAMICLLSKHDTYPHQTRQATNTFSPLTQKIVFQKAAIKRTASTIHLLTSFPKGIYYRVQYTSSSINLIQRSSKIMLFSIGHCNF